MAEEEETPPALATLSLSFDAIEPVELQTEEGYALVHAAGVPTLRVRAEDRQVRAVELTPEERVQLTEYLWQTVMTLCERHELIDPAGAYQTRLEASLTVGVHLYPDDKDKGAKAHPGGPRGALLDALHGPTGARKAAPRG